MKVNVTVFVSSIKKTPTGAVVTAANGGIDGPPFVSFHIPIVEEKKCHLGKRYYLTIEGEE